MGRRPHALIQEFFDRGPKLDDSSNRYQHTCKRCSEFVRLLYHLKVFYQLLVDQRTVSERADRQPYYSLAPSLPKPDSARSDLGVPAAPTQCRKAFQTGEADA